VVGAKRGVWGRKGFSVGEEESALGLVLRRTWLGMIGNVFFCSERIFSKPVTGPFVEWNPLDVGPTF